MKKELMISLVMSHLAKKSVEAQIKKLGVEAYRARMKAKSKKALKARWSKKVGNAKDKK